jgi:hypothetical protein
MTFATWREPKGLVSRLCVGPRPEFVPEHVNGDQDFGVHAPQVDITTRIESEIPEKSELRFGCEPGKLKAMGLRPQGSTNFMLYRNERPILAILSDTFSSLSYIDTNHNRDEFPLSLNDLVSKFECVGYATRRGG